jgi:optic atrophy 3 protein
LISKLFFFISRPSQQNNFHSFFDHLSYSIAKLAGLLIKTLSKPLSKRIKLEFSKSTTGTSILHTIGQASQNVTSRMTIWSAGYKVRNIQPLPSDKAIQIGSEFVGESFVLILSAGVIIYEYQRSKLKEMEKSEKLNAIATQERFELQQQLNNIHIRIQSIEQTIQLIQERQLLKQIEEEVDDEHHQQQQQQQQGPKTSSSSSSLNKLLKLIYWWK